MFLHIIVFFMLVCGTRCQELQECLKYRSEEYPGRAEVHCSCMQQLIKWNEPIQKLIINQTGCEQSVLEIDWGVLQSYIGVKKVVFDSATISFLPMTEKRGKFSVEELIFLNSYFRKLPNFAFNGLKAIKKIEIIDSKIELIESIAFSGYDSLSEVTFMRTEVGSIRSKAFYNLPRIQKIAFVRATIRELDTEAIFLMNSDENKQKKCLKPTRGRSFLESIGSEISSRTLQVMENETLPENGKKLIFLLSKISQISRQSIKTNDVSFIIFAGNDIQYVEAQFILAEIKNDCDVSAFLLIENTFNNIPSGAFKDIRADQNKLYNTVFTIMNNTFNNVEAEGFLLNEFPGIPFAKKNKFRCSSCKNFPWLLSNEDSEIQLMLERMLVETGLCIKETTTLLDYLKNCNGTAIITTMAKPHKNVTYKIEEHPTHNGVEEKLNAPASSNRLTTLIYSYLLMTIISMLI